MRYKVAIHVTDEGYSVSLPALPGCWSEGDTEEEALENIRDAIREYLAALEDRTKNADIREWRRRDFRRTQNRYRRCIAVAVYKFVANTLTSTLK